MKRMITLALVVAGLGYTSYASAQNAAIKVDVPFDFAVGNHVLPSGEYRISHDGGTLVLESRDHRAHLYTVAEPGDTAKDGKSKLTFDVVQGQYFLRKIASTSSSTSAEFPASRLEKKSRELSMQQAKWQEPEQSSTIYAETARR